MMEQQKALLDSMLSTIINDDIRSFAKVLVEDFPTYVWEVPASSSGRFHPLHDQGEGGLIRHLVAVTRMLNYFFELEQYNTKLSDREMDLMRVAALTHDARKSGEQGDFERSKTTKFEHPLLMAQAIRKWQGQYLSESEIELIASMVETHMGQWNSSKKADFELPKPSNNYQRLIHLADYLASRKELNMEFESWTPPKVELPDVNTYILNFGKMKGHTIPEIAQIDISYLYWAQQNLNRQPELTLINNFLKKKTEDII